MNKEEKGVAHYLRNYSQKASFEGRGVSEAGEAETGPKGIVKSALLQSLHACFCLCAKGLT